MRTKSDSRYIICSKCHNTILIAKHPNAIPQYINRIHNPYRDPEGLLNPENTKTILVKNINNPLNRTTGLLESIFNPLVDPYAIEKEFERFLRIVANKEFNSWKNNLKKKEKELSLNYFEGSNKYNIFKPLLDLNKYNLNHLKNKRYDENNSYIYNGNNKYERYDYLKKTGYVINTNDNLSAFVPLSKEYNFNAYEYRNPYKDNNSDNVYNYIQKRLNYKLGNTNLTFNDICK